MSNKTIRRMVGGIGAGLILLICAVIIGIYVMSGRQLQRIDVPQYVDVTQNEQGEYEFKLNVDRMIYEEHLVNPPADALDRYPEIGALQSLGLRVAEQGGEYVFTTVTYGEDPTAALKKGGIKLINTEWSWTKEQVKVLLSGAYRLRNFDNRYKEVDELSVDELTSLNQNSNENEKYSESDERVYESAKDDEGCIPTVDEYYFSMQEERVRLALCVPEIISFGKEVKKELRQIGEISSDCCSRANEIAQGMCYLLYIANGLADVPESERDGEYHETLRRIIDVARWWIKMSIDSAISVQTELNANSKSHREEIRMAYKQRAGESATRLIYNEREEVFKRYEAEHAGEIVTAREVRDSSQILQKVVIRTVTRNLQDRGWKEVSRGKWRVPGQKTEEKL